MDQLKLKLQQELIASINKETTPKYVKNKNKGSLLLLDRSIVEHIKKSRLEKVNNEVNDEMLNHSDEMDAKEMKDQVPKVFHTNEVEDQDPKVFHPNKMVDQDPNVFQANERDDQYPKVFHVEDQNPKVFQANEIGNFRENKKRKNLDIESSKLSKKFKKVDLKQILISEFDKIYDRTKIPKDSDDSIDCMLLSDHHEKIICIYNETKKNDYTKWQNVKLFLKLTKSKNIDEIVKILGLKKENFRKKLEAFKKVDKYISYLHQSDFCKLELPISYFQKISISDWNQVLYHLEMKHKK